jgi:hypothetical protein
MLMINIHEDFLGYVRISVDCKLFIDYSLFCLISGLACLPSLYFVKILDRKYYYTIIMISLIKIIIIR